MDMSIFMLKIDISYFSVDPIDMKTAYVDFLIEFRHIFECYCWWRWSI